MTWLSRNFSSVFTIYRKQILKNCSSYWTTHCYGASNVSGEITGLPTRFRGIEPRAIYTHCAGHNLNIVAHDGMKIIPEIADFLSNMKHLVTFCRASAKRNNIFKSIVFDEEEDDEVENFEGKIDDKFGSLKPFCPSRWIVRVKSLKSIRDNYKFFFEIMWNCRVRHYGDCNQGKRFYKLFTKILVSHFVVDLYCCTRDNRSVERHHSSDDHYI